MDPSTESALSKRLLLLFISPQNVDPYKKRSLWFLLIPVREDSFIYARTIYFQAPHQALVLRWRPLTWELGG